MPAFSGLLFVTKRTMLVARTLRWMWMYEPGAWGCGRASSMGADEGEEPLVRTGEGEAVTAAIAKV